jgi:hypothetical protein
LIRNKSVVNKSIVNNNIISKRIMNKSIINRSMINPIQKEAKRQGKRVALIRDRLYIENELYVPAEEIDEAGDFDTPLQPHNVWSTPRNSGDRRPPKRQRVSSTTPERG